MNPQAPLCPSPRHRLPTPRQNHCQHSELCRCAVPDAGSPPRSPNPTRNAGTFSGAGSTLQGLIAATAKKDSGLAKPLADAIDHLIKNGQYAAWLKAWNLSNEAVAKSEVNPPGLPLDNS